MAELDLDAHALQLAGDGAGGRICLTVGVCVPPALVIGGLVPVVGYRHDNRAFGKYLGVLLDYGAGVCPAVLA